MNKDNEVTAPDEKDLEPGTYTKIDRVLSEEEMERLHNQGRGLNYPFTNDVDASEEGEVDG